MRMGCCFAVFHPFSKLQNVRVRNFDANRLLSSVTGKAVFEKNGFQSFRDQDATNRKMNIARPVARFHTLSGKGGILAHDRSLSLCS